MENFTVYNPTKVLFGTGIIKSLGTETKSYGSKALLVYGKGSVKKYGYYDQVVDQLKQSGIEIVEYEGIKPNPILEDVEAASALGRKEAVDVVVAVGGGSVIDSAKIIALGIANNENTWDYMTQKKKPEITLPLIAILTLAATGTEMNAAAVVQNHATGEKIGYAHPLNFPKASFLDPSFTITVPANYTAFGIVDLIAHALELYFGKGDASLTDRITFSIIQDAMDWGPKLLSDLSNVEMRANIMLDAMAALNGITAYGKQSGDWGVHMLGHEMSLLFDTPHGASLSIVYPAWLKVHKEIIPDRIIKLGTALFGVDNVDATISGLEDFFKQIGSPIRLSEINIDATMANDMLKQYKNNEINGVNLPLAAHYQKLIELML